MGLREQYVSALHARRRSSRIVQSLLDVPQAFYDPTQYKLRVKSRQRGSDESNATNVDRPRETFNWLIGLSVHT